MAANYEIISQIPRTRSDPGGQFAQVMAITFRTKPSAQPGIVDIPMSAYTVDEVDRILAAAAARIEEIQAL